MSIRDNYVSAFNSIARNHGEAHFTAQIGPLDSSKPPSDIPGNTL